MNRIKTTPALTIREKLIVAAIATAIGLGIGSVIGLLYWLAMSTYERLCS